MGNKGRMAIIIFASVLTTGCVGFFNDTLTDIRQKNDFPLETGLYAEGSISETDGGIETGIREISVNEATATDTESTAVTEPVSETAEETTKKPEATKPVTTVTPITTKKEEPFDLFEYCKEFAIEIGKVNGDYVMYQQPSTRYGGYEDEFFSMSYWGDSDRVEFCLHCPLSDTFSINFYLTMRGGFNHKYEWSSSRYYRDTGESLRFAWGYLDPAKFSKKRPLNCSEYVGSSDGQDDFMEESRVGICDLISCLKQFVKVEKMTCGFGAFELKNF